MPPQTGADGRRRPSLDLLRDLTDAHVIDQLLTVGELTRADLASRTKISKPTISESVRRLEASGLIGESGRQSGKRGPSASFYRLRSDAVSSLALSVGPDGVQAELRDLSGELLARRVTGVTSPIRAAALAPAITAAVDDVLDAEHGPVVSASVSAANPVDRASGRLVQLPDSPFLLDELDLFGLLDERLEVRVEVDNDVNWAALAEHRVGAARDLEDFVYCYLGPGLGAAVVTGGAIVHGRHGLAGELAHVLTTGDDGRARRLVQCFADWGLLRPQSSAIDVDRLRTELNEDPERRRAVVTALVGALSSSTALLNPAGVVIGGPWSDVEGLVDDIASAFAEIAAVPADVRQATLGLDAPLVGARTDAVRRAQHSLTR